MSWTKLFFIFLLLASCAKLEAQVTDLELTKSGSDVVLTWNTGTGPYRVLGSGTPNFYYANSVLAESLASPATTLPGALTSETQPTFIEVLTITDGDPEGFGDNPPLPSPPMLTSLSPDSGPPGTVVYLDGSGFVADGSRMSVTFHHALAEIVVVSASKLQVIVPPGAVSGGVRVCIDSDRCSNPLLFLVRYGPLFEDLSSIAYEAGTGSLWVAERGLAETIYEIDATGTLHDRGGTLAAPILGAPSPPSGSGRVRYSNTSEVTSNIGPIRTIDSATNEEFGFDFAGEAGDHVWCQGLAARDDQGNIVYFLDGVDNTVRRIVQNAPSHDLNFGNTNLLVFNRPAGARFDSQNNLYVSSTTQIYRIDPNQVTTLVAAGFTAAAGIDLVEIGGVPLLAVADEAAGEVQLVNTATGNRSVIASGLSGPVGVAFASGEGAAGTALYVAEPGRILRFPSAQLEFETLAGKRVLLSKAAADDRYPSRDQTEDGKIRLKVILNSVLPTAGLTAHFRVVDPPDSSRYITGAAEGDNLGSSPGATILTPVPFNLDGEAETTLTVSEEISGNNFIVEASLAGGAEFRPLARSPVYTAWRRLYLELDSMWKDGEFVNGDSGAGQPDPTVIKVNNPASFAPGEPVHLLSGSSETTAKGEFGTIVSVEADHVKVDMGTCSGSTPAPCDSYLDSWESDPPATDVFPFAFLARTTAGGFGAPPPSVANLRFAFGDAFAEVLVRPDMKGRVPHWTTLPAPDTAAAAFVNERSPRFFNSELGRPQGASFNTVHVVSGDVGYDPTVLGITNRTNGQDWCWLFDTSIGSTYPGALFAEARDGVLAHELSHQFGVNGATNGHDEEPAWTPDETRCLMKFDADMSLGIARTHMHATAGTGMNDLMCVRTHGNDINLTLACLVP